jgi:hypothetical protein
MPLCISLVEEGNFGSESGYLAGRVRDLILFASPAQLLSAKMAAGSGWATPLTTSLFQSPRRGAVLRRFPNTNSRPLSSVVFITVSSV